MVWSSKNGQKLLCDLILELHVLRSRDQFLPHSMSLQTRTSSSNVDYVLERETILFPCSHRLPTFLPSSETRSCWREGVLLQRFFSSNDSGRRENFWFCEWAKSLKKPRRERRENVQFMSMMRSLNSVTPLLSSYSLALSCYSLIFFFIPFLSLSSVIFWLGIFFTLFKLRVFPKMSSSKTHSWTRENLFFTSGSRQQPFTSNVGPKGRSNLNNFSSESFSQHVFNVSKFFFI